MKEPVCALLLYWVTAIFPRPCARVTVPMFWVSTFCPAATKKLPPLRLIADATLMRDVLSLRPVLSSINWP